MGQTKLAFISARAGHLFAISVIALLAFGLCAKMFFEGIIFAGHDIWVHLVWLKQFAAEFAQGVYYPRWLGGSNYGFGSPTFVFYPPLIYYIGTPLILGLHCTPDTAINLLFFMGTLLSGLSFYLFGYARLGKSGSLCGALAFITFPYFIYDLYMRTALAELWGLALLPFVFWSVDKAAAARNHLVILPAVAFAVLTLTHLPGLLSTTIAYAIYVICIHARLKPARKAFFLCCPFFGASLAAPYLYSALMERSLVSIEEMKQTGGGWSGNLLGGADFIKLEFLQDICLYSFICLLAIGALSVYFLRQEPQNRKETFFCIGTACGVLLMLTPLSAPLWQNSGVLQMLQFPWRFLGLFDFCLAILVGLCAVALRHAWQCMQIGRWAILAVLLFVLIGNLMNFVLTTRLRSGLHAEGSFLPDIPGRPPGFAAARQRVVSQILDEQFAEALPDVEEYRPAIKSTGKPAPEPVQAVARVRIVSGEAAVKGGYWLGCRRQFAIEAQQPSTIEIRTYVYPHWVVTVDGAATQPQQAENGAMRIALKEGTHDIAMNYDWRSGLIQGFSIAMAAAVVLQLSAWLVVRDQPGAPATK